MGKRGTEQQEECPGSSADTDLLTYLTSLPAIRSQCQKIYNHVQIHPDDPKVYFQLNLEAITRVVVPRLMAVIERDYPQSAGGLATVPPHSRWRHYDMGGVDRLKAFDAPTVLDLFMVSVLLDAGAGPQWKFRESRTGEEFGRSEGIALAVLEGFECGAFAKDAVPARVDAEGLKGVTKERLEEVFQVRKRGEKGNEALVGLHQRVEVLKRLGAALERLPEVYGSEGRPGNLVRYLQERASDNCIHVGVLWNVLMTTLSSVWPAGNGRLSLSGHPLGDVWYSPLLGPSSRSSSLTDPDPTTLVPFHKLTQWLAYSLNDLFDRLTPLHITNLTFLTGLPEYRNGGLLIDAGVLSLKDLSLSEHTFTPSHPMVVEWRALTVVLLDKVAEALREALGVTEGEMELAKVLEAGTWKLGRELASELRPDTASPPLRIQSDGTVF